jgi:hypothetical protein
VATSYRNGRPIGKMVIDLEKAHATGNPNLTEAIGEQVRERGGDGWII